MSTDAQVRLILAHLRKGLTLTAKEARALFRCDRLAARIKDLRYSGHDIYTTMESGGGKRWARYSLIKEAQDG